jgi:hypothetical protein
VFGRVLVIENRAEKAKFFDEFMARYHPGEGGTRAAGFYPQLDVVTVYAMTTDRITGKETVLPAAGARWPAIDRTRTPNARAPLPSEG